MDRDTLAAALAECDPCEAADLVIDAVERARERGRADAGAWLRAALNGSAETVAKAWEAEDHPRDDGGRFVSKGDIAAARTDVAKADELRSRVTDPDERAKLERHLGTPAGPRVDVSDPAALADAVHAAATRLPSWSGNRAEPGQYHNHSVYISDLYDALKHDLGGASLEDFKAAVLKANGTGHLMAARLDLQHLGDRAKTDRSHTPHPLGAEFHLVNVPPGKLAAGAEKADAAKPPPPKEWGPEALERVYDDLFAGHKVGALLPVHKMRDLVRERYGERAASHEVFDEAMHDLRRAGKMKLVPSDPGTTHRFTPEEAAGHIPNRHVGTLVYAERPGGHTPAAGADPSAPEPVPPAPKTAPTKPPTVDGTHELARRLFGPQSDVPPADAVKQMAQAFAGHTHAELAELKQRLGIKASGAKVAQAQKIAERLSRGDTTNLRERTAERVTVDEAHDLIRGHAAAGRLDDPATVKDVARMLSHQMSVKELGELKKRLGVRASGPKWELAKKIAERVGAGTPAPSGGYGPRTATKHNTPFDRWRELAHASLDAHYTYEGNELNDKTARRLYDAGHSPERAASEAMTRRGGASQGMMLAHEQMRPPDADGPTETTVTRQPAMPEVAVPTPAPAGVAPRDGAGATPAALTATDVATPTPAAQNAPAPKPGEGYQYAPVGSIDTPAQGVLNAARAHKTAAWKRVQQIRQQIKDEPLGGNRQGLRLELIKAESAHGDAMASERAALAEIERRAKELGKTTIKPAK